MWLKASLLLFSTLVQQPFEDRDLSACWWPLIYTQGISVNIGLTYVEHDDSLSRWWFCRLGITSSYLSLSKFLSKLCGHRPHALAENCLSYMNNIFFNTDKYMYLARNDNVITNYEIDSDFCFNVLVLIIRQTFWSRKNKDRKTCYWKRGRRKQENT